VPFTPSVRNAIEEELQRAEQARQLGLEGRARVCARRATGLALRAFFEIGDEGVNTSVIPLLQRLRDSQDVPEAIRRVAEHLLTRVTPEFTLPFQADLIAEARWLINELENLKRTE
jgi:uncharacterized protein (UPF0147 family)